MALWVGATRGPWECVQVGSAQCPDVPGVAVDSMWVGAAFPRGGCHRCALAGQRPAGAATLADDCSFRQAHSRTSCSPSRTDLGWCHHEATSGGLWGLAKLSRRVFSWARCHGGLPGPAPASWQVVAHIVGSGRFLSKTRICPTPFLPPHFPFSKSIASHHMFNITALRLIMFNNKTGGV